MADSILSSEERALAERLRAGATPAELADDLDRDPEAVEKACDRIREKTARALATLRESPYTAEAAATLAPEERDRIREALEED
ncbi:MAG: hypothetical protein ABEJ30_03140 [Halorientalis sp.]